MQTIRLDEEGLTIAALVAVAAKIGEVA